MKYIDKYQILYNIFNTMGQIEKHWGYQISDLQKVKVNLFFSLDQVFKNSRCQNTTGENRERETEAGSGLSVKAI